jgi:hypothetical protein
MSEGDWCSTLPTHQTTPTRDTRHERHDLPVFHRPPASPQHQPAVPSLARPVKRERDFGVGYGSSSGYAAATRYVSDRTTPRFRFG